MRLATTISDHRAVIAFFIYRKMGQLTGLVLAGFFSFLLGAVSLAANAVPVKYFTSFDEQGSWVEDSYIYVDEANSRLYWNTDTGQRAAYDDINLVTEVGDVIDFEYEYTTHSDSNTRQIVRFGFTDELPYTPNKYPENFIGGYSTNYYSQAQSGIQVTRNGSALFNWSLYHTRGVATTFVGKVSILSVSEFQVQLWNDGGLILDQTVAGDATGLPLTMAAGWNGEVHPYPIQGTYTGQLDYLSWSVIPEPTTALLFAGGLTALAMRRRLST